MTFSVGLYRDFARQGRITFRSLPATQSSEYEKVVKRMLGIPPRFAKINRTGARYSYSSQIESYPLARLLQWIEMLAKKS